MQFALVQLMVILTNDQVLSVNTSLLGTESDT